MSVKVTPVKGIEFALLSVKLNVEMPFTEIGFGEKSLVISGGLGMAHPVKVTSSMYKSEPGLLFLAYAP